jgi:uncharacterized protein (TIGR01777 family)
MKILVTGASGFVGQRLIDRLLKKGYEINSLSTRSDARIRGTTAYHWQPNDFEMDEGALDGVEGIIHLAGATVSKRWTPQYKQEIFDSRTRTAETLFRAIAKAKQHTIKSFISASAVGYYPSNADKLYTEDADPANDFLGQVCQQWERAGDKISQLNVRVVKLRIGIVLGRGGGVLQQLERPTRFGLGAPLGTGKQWMSWIHLDDLCRLFIFALENERVTGAINAGGAQSVTNKAMSKALAKAMNKPFFFPPVPAFALKLLLGEMATLALMSQKVSDAKTRNLGFVYQFNTLEDALTEMYQP